MYAETEGIILKQIKIAGGRKMLVIFTKRFGKISAGTSLKENSKNKATLALRPFVYGKYRINKTGKYYHVNGAEVISSNYQIGEDVDKFMSASYVLEFTEKLLPEEAPDPKLFRLLTDFLDLLEKRKKKFDTLVIAYQVKALAYNGSFPRLDACVLCNEKEQIKYFSVAEGGVVCEQCGEGSKAKELLLYTIDFGIVEVLRYLLEQPLSSFIRLALDDNILQEVRKVLKEYIVYHLEVDDLKSEEFMN
ncbi:MAG: DNA repair protein RecO [Clostridiales bacterium]|jgi:DNA repair protein RecO (recombination protein O)|nr:DNA repair protein RecO [Clostridiales bacterium]